MILDKLIAYCRAKTWVNSLEVAQYLGREVASIEGMLQLLEARKMLCRLSSGCSGGACSNCSFKCGLGPKAVLYKWSGA